MMKVGSISHSISFVYHGMRNAYMKVILF